MINVIDKIYVYKMTTDNGSAPCVYNDVLSLAICMPGIRSTAQKGDWIVGIGGKKIGERLIYIAQITEKLENGAYYKLEKYFIRPDCIYRWQDYKNKYYWVKDKLYHKDELELEHDLGSNANVLISNNFTYFGDKGTENYKISFRILKKEIEKLGRGHRVNHTKELFEELKLLIKESIKLTIKGKPTDKNNCGKCNKR